MKRINMTVTDENEKKLRLIMALNDLISWNDLISYFLSKETINYPVAILDNSNTKA